jgi:hypothetical protein
MCADNGGKSMRYAKAWRGKFFNDDRQHPVDGQLNPHLVALPSTMWQEVHLFAAAMHYYYRHDRAARRSLRRDVFGCVEES